MMRRRWPAERTRMICSRVLNEDLARNETPRPRARWWMK